MSNHLPQPDPPVVAATSGGPDVSADAAPRPAGSTGPLWLVLFVALVVCTNVANSMFARLVGSNPLGLLALSSRNRYLTLTAIDADISWVRWGAMAMVRLGAAALVCHMIGRTYGDRALRWFWKFLGMREDNVRIFERQFEVAEVVLVPLFVGSNLVWAVSGAAKSSWRKLVPLFVIGVVARLALIWWLAHAFEDQLRKVVDVMTRYQWPIVGVSIGLVLLVNLANLRRGR